MTRNYPSREYSAADQVGPDQCRGPRSDIRILSVSARFFSGCVLKGLTPSSCHRLAMPSSEKRQVESCKHQLLKFMS